MNAEIKGAPAFAHIHVTLEPGESVVAESGAMATMSAEIDPKTSLNGGFFSAIKKKFLGGESLFVNTFTNNAGESKEVVLTNSAPGDMLAIELNNESLCLQPGAYIASTPGIKLGTKWAGFGSLIAREGLFKLHASGTGTLWYGAYGGLVEKEVKGEYIVDTAHLVAYEPQLKLKTQLAGGLISSITSGEGLVTRIEGEGKIVMQTRSLSGLAGWANRFM